MGGTGGACLSHPLVTADTCFAVEGSGLHAVDAHNLVDADSVLVALTSTCLLAVEKATGRTAWEVPGQYHKSFPSMAA